eukprot:6384605-Prymnesium_polylepis.2
MCTPSHLVLVTSSTVVFHPGRPLGWILFGPHGGTGHRAAVGEGLELEAHGHDVVVRRAVAPFATQPLEALATGGAQHLEQGLAARPFDDA